MLLIKPSEIKWDSPKHVLGRGSFGIVYRSKENGWQGDTVAVKELLTAGAVPQSERDAFQKEAAVLASLNHRHVVRFLGVWLEGSAPMLVTEFVEGGTLDKALYGGGSLSGAGKLRIARGIAAGLYHIHFKNILHRDLKPANVLLDAAGNAKIADVGLARALHASGTKKFLSASTMGGTPVYMSPEQWDETTLTPKSDVYSFGVILNEMDTGVEPWRDVQSFMAVGRKVTNGERPQPVGTGKLGELAKRCWGDKPAERISIETALDELS